MILLTDATTEDGEDEVATYFKVKKQWAELLDQWNEEGKFFIGFKRYYELLFLVNTRNCDELPKSSQRTPRELQESSHLQALAKYVS